MYLHKKEIGTRDKNIRLDTEFHRLACRRLQAGRLSRLWNVE